MINCEVNYFSGGKPKVSRQSILSLSGWWLGGPARWGEKKKVKIVGTKVNP